MKLTRLRIRDFVLIEDLELELGDGLNVLSGGSGEGKTLIVRALDFLLSGQPLGRARAGALVRQGASQAWVEATLGGTSAALEEALRAAGLPPRAVGSSGGAAPLVVSRALDRAGRGACAVDGASVPLTALRPIGAALLEVFGQGEAAGLVHEDRQREVLDLAAGLAREARAYAEARARALTLARERDGVAAEEERLRDDRARAAEERAALAELDPRPGEYPALVEELARLEQREADLRQLAAVVELVDAEEPEAGAACDRLRQAVARLDRLARAADGPLAAARQALDEALALAAQAAERLRRAQEQVDLDPARVEALRARVASFRALARRLRAAPEALAERWVEAGQRDPAALAERRERLDAALRAQAPDLLARRDALSRGRAEGAARLSRAVARRLPDLGLPGARFEVLVSEAQAPPATSGEEAAQALLRGHPAAHGRDRVSFLFAAGPAQPLGPFERASGGELARLFLALAVESAPGASDVPLLVFDEVDQNVGARLGAAVGGCLAGIGRGRQVLAITHLATVAARADHHARIVKQDGRTRVERLEGPARVEELALMLKGPPLTEAALAQARELLAEAAGSGRPRAARGARHAQRKGARPRGRGAGGSRGPARTERRKGAARA